MSVRITTNCLIHIYWPRVRVLETERMSAEKTNLTGMEGGHPDTAPHTPRTLCVSACHIAAAEFLYQNNLKLALFKWCGLGVGGRDCEALDILTQRPIEDLLCLIRKTREESIKNVHISVLLLPHRVSTQVVLCKVSKTPGPRCGARHHSAESWQPDT